MSTEKINAEKKQTFSDSAFDPYDLLGQGVKNGKKYAADVHQESVRNTNPTAERRDDFL